MNDHELENLTIAKAGHELRAGHMSPVELTQSYLERIKRYDAVLHSVVTLTEERALEDAHRAERELAQGIDRGPMHGIPYGLKDIIDSRGIRTTCHSRLLLDNVPAQDAEVAKRLHEGGGILLGKMTTHEFAIGGPAFDLPFPPARNPWHTDHFTGGSSSGSGAAVAAALMPLALGTDTGGSIRLPAAYCGIAGIKPTYGRVSRRGVAPLSYTLDHVGPLAWRVEDCALALQILAGHDPSDPGSATVAVPNYMALMKGDVRGLKIGYLRQFHAEGVDPELVAGMDAAVAKLVELGAEVHDISLPAMRLFQSVQQAILSAESLSIHAANLRKYPDQYCRNSLERMSMGCFVTGVDVIDAQRVRRQLTEAVDAVLREVDVIACAAVPSPAPRIEDVELVPFRSQPPLTAPFNATGHPALSLCCGYSQAGLPLSLQLVGRYFEEATLFRMGYVYEQATEWRLRRPELEKASTTEAVV